MADSRGFFKLTNGFPEHWKVEEVGGDAGWLHVCALAYCSRNLTDGLIPISIVPRLSDRENPKQIARALLDVGLWHAAGHACKKCVQPDARHYVIHDYLDHQTSAERARETSAKRAIAGQRGGKAKAAVGNLPSNLPGRGYDDASSKSLAEEEQEEEVHKTKTSSSSRRATTAPKQLEITGGMYAWAANEHALSRKTVEFETSRFLDHHRARGTTFKDWTAAWRNWMARVNEYSPRGAQLSLESESPTDAPPRPEWCGKCDPQTRMVENADRIPGRCPRCHPSTQKANA